MRIGPFAAAVALLGAVGRAQASPLADDAFGGIVFTGPVQAGAAAIFFNPAALCLDRGTRIQLSGTLHYDQISIDRAPIDPDTGAPGGSRAIPGVDASVLTPSGMVAAVKDWHPVVAAIALSTPYAERWVDGQDALRYHVLAGSNYSYTLTLAGAFRSSRLSFGLAFSLGPSRLRWSFAQDTALDGGSAGLASDCGGAACGAENPAAARRYDVSVESPFISVAGVALNAGVAFRVQSTWWAGLGLSNFSFGQLEALGTVDITNPPRDVDAGAPEHSTGRAAVGYDLPWALYAGVRGEVLPRYDLFLGTRLTRTARHDQLDLRLYAGDFAADVPDWYPRYRGLRDVWLLEAGLEGREHQTVRLGGRVRFESGAVDAARISPMQIEGWNLALAGGLEVRPTPGMALQVGYQLRWYPTQSPDPGVFDPVARAACVDSQFDFDTCAAAREGRAIPTAAGDYGRLRHTATVGVRFDL